MELDQVDGEHRMNSQSMAKRSFSDRDSIYGPESMSEQSADDQTNLNDLAIDDYDHDDGTEMPSSAATNELDKPYSLLREKINTVVDEFQDRLHTILDEHFVLEQKLMDLSEASKDSHSSVDSGNEASGSGNGSEFFSSVQGKSPTQLPYLAVEAERIMSAKKDKKIIELFTYASIISATIRRSEFKV